MEPQVPLVANVALVQPVDTPEASTQEVVTAGAPTDNDDTEVLTGLPFAADDTQEIPIVTDELDDQQGPTSEDWEDYDGDKLFDFFDGGREDMSGRDIRRERRARREAANPDDETVVLPKMSAAPRFALSAGILGVPKAVRRDSAEAPGMTMRQRLGKLWDRTSKFYDSYAAAVEGVEHSSIVQTVRRVISETRSWARNEVQPALAAMQDWARNEAMPALAALHNEVSPVLPSVKQHLVHDLPVKIDQAGQQVGAQVADWGRNEGLPAVIAVQEHLAARYLQVLGSLGVVGFIERQLAVSAKQNSSTGSTGA
jgi:hypothetical protein